MTRVTLAHSQISFRLACDEQEAHRLLRGAGVAYSLTPEPRERIPVIRLLLDQHTHRHIGLVRED